MNVEARQTGISETEKEYRIKLTRSLRNRITLGDPRTIERILQAFITATKHNRRVVLDDRMVFHSKRPSPSRQDEDNVYGIPLLMPVLSDLFLCRVLKKAQEMVAMEHVVPLRMLFPQVRVSADNVYGNVNLRDFQKSVTNQVSQWKRDSNHIAVMASPVGYQQIGGQGRALMMFQELRAIYEQIISGMGVPVSFFYGEAQFSGASVNMKGLENEYMSNRMDMTNHVNFIFDQIYPLLNIPRFGNIGLTPFKMADDMQRMAFDFQLNQAGKISDQSLLSRTGHDYADEVSKMMEERGQSASTMIEQAKAQAEAQGRATLVSMRYQRKAQEEQANMGGMPGQEAPPPGEGEPPPEGEQPQEQAPPEEASTAQPDTAANALQETGMTSGSELNTEGEQRYFDIFAQAQRAAEELKNMPYSDRMTTLNQIRQDNPVFYRMVNEKLNGLPSSNRQDNPLPQLVRR